MSEGSGAERLLNLVVALQRSPDGLTKSQLAARVAGYGDGAAFERMFSRDKEALERVGFDLSVTLSERGSVYRLSARALDGDFSVSQVELVSRLSDLMCSKFGWDVSEAASSVLGLSAGGAAGAAVLPSLDFAGAALVPDLLGAVEAGHEVSFAYAGGARRTVQPWRVVAALGSFYLLGLDVNCGERTFRLSRMQGLQVASARSFSVTDEQRRRPVFSEGAVCPVVRASASALERLRPLVDSEFEDGSLRLSAAPLGFWLRELSPLVGAVAVLEPPSFVELWSSRASRVGELLSVD